MQRSQEGVARPPSLMGYPSYLVAQVNKAAYRALSERIAAHRVTPAHFAVLAAVDDLGPLTQQQLAASLDIDKSQMVALVDQLERVAAVVRELDPNDRRCRRIAVTEEGRRLAGVLHELDEASQDELLAPLDPAERQQLAELLGRVVRWHDARRRAATRTEPAQ